MTSNTARELIANAMAEKRRIDAGEELRTTDACDLYNADAVLAALPSIIGEMVQPLEWVESTHLKKIESGPYVVQHEYDAGGNGCWAFAINYSWVSDHETRHLAIEAANAHHRATILKALGMKEQGE